MSKLMIRDSPFVRLLKAVGLVSINPDGEIDHSAGADYISNHGFKPQYDSTTAMSVLAAFPFPYACVTAISTDLSSVPIRVYRGRGANAEQLDNHPLIDLLEQPSSRVSGVAFRRQIYTDATLVGNCYVLIAGNREPESLLRLHPSRITISPLQDGQPDKYIYAGGGQPTTYDYTQVLHMRSPSWSDDPTSLWGVGSVQPLHHDLMTEKAQSELAARTAATGQPTGILSPKADGDLWNKRQIDTLRQALEMQLSKGGSGILITGGQSEFTKLAFSPRELEFSSVRDYARTATLSAFGVVPVRLGIESQNFATATNQLKLYWEGLAGRAALIDSELTRLARMFGDDDVHVKHDFSGVAVLQESRTERVKRVLDWTMTGVPLSVAAAYEGFEDLPITQSDDAMMDKPEEAPAEEVEAEPDADAEAPAAAEDRAEPLAATALNGAQVASMLTILEQVASGVLSPASAVVLIQVSFPTVSEEQAQAIVEGAGAPSSEDAAPTEERSLSDLSEAVQTGLRNRAEKHNEEVDEKGMAEWRKTTARTLGAVFKRGVGAYNTNPGSVRPSVSSPEEWAYARVKSFIYVLKNDRFRSGKHDTDLLPAEHPMSSKEKTTEKKNDDLTVVRQYESIDFSVPDGVVDELQRGLRWHEEGESGDGLTPATVSWARRMANGEDISPDKARKMSAWFARHESDKDGEGFNPGETGYPSPGRVAWALWGGDPAVTWSAKLVRQMDRADQMKHLRTRMDDLIWRNFIQDVQQPIERQMQTAMEGYLAGFAARIAERLPTIIEPFQRSIMRSVDDADVVIKQGDEPWLDSLLDYGLENDELNSAMRDSFRAAYEESARAAIDSMPESMADDFTFPSQRIDDDVDRSLGELVQNVQDQTRHDVNRIVRDGLAEGMSVNEMQSILQGVTTLDSTGKMLYAFSPARALAIARTESTRAVNAGGVKTWESAAAQAGVVVNFRWLSQPGARDEHAKLHNKLREPDGFWYGGGVKGSAPGNFVGSKKATAAMNINCRCTFTPEIT